MTSKSSLDFESLISALQQYWRLEGCAIAQPIDQPVGAGTSHPLTFFGALGPKPTAVAYVQASRRPSDGRYGQHPNRLQHYYQFQVLKKPSPPDPLETYLRSLEYLSPSLLSHDIRFVEDNWENPSLGASGLGWEVWLDGAEISQITYFQQMGGVICMPESLEITYGLERLACILQNRDSIYDLVWSKPAGCTYGEWFQASELQNSQFQFEFNAVSDLHQSFEMACRTVDDLVAMDSPWMPLPAYSAFLRASELFNLLEARKALSVTERQRLLLSLKKRSSSIAEREAHGQ